MKLIDDMKEVFLSLYVAYVLVGLAIAMPVGAITVEMTKQGLKMVLCTAGQLGLVA